MAEESLGPSWEALGAEALTGMREWRREHPRATWAELEQAVEERLGRLKAQMLQDSAQASAAARWGGTPEAQRPRCPYCGEGLTPRGDHSRRLATAGGREVKLQRSYGVCARCGAELFPPG